MALEDSFLCGEDSVWYNWGWCGGDAVCGVSHHNTIKEVTAMICLQLVCCLLAWLACPGPGSWFPLLCPEGSCLVPLPADGSYCSHLKIAVYLLQFVGIIFVGTILSKTQ